MSHHEDHEGEGLVHKRKTITGPFGKKIPHNDYERSKSENVDIYKVSTLEPKEAPEDFDIDSEE